MTTQQITFLLPPYGTAALTLPEVLTSEAFFRIQSAVGEALREPCGGGTCDAANDAGAIEYASWSIQQC